MCVLPSLIALFGGDLGVAFDATDRPIDRSLDTPFAGMSIHALFEWSTLCTGITALFFAAFHYRLTRDDTSLITGVALCTVGCISGFHALVNAGLLDLGIENLALASLSYSLSRALEGAIILVGVTLLIIGERHPAGRRSWFVVAIGVAATIAAYLVIADAARAVSASPAEADGHGYRALALAVFGITAIIAAPMLYLRRPGYVTGTLALGAIPAFVGQLHLTFGSQTPFDHHVNAANALGLLSIGVPLLGIGLDYMRLYREREFGLRAREQSNDALRASEARVRAIVDTAVDAVITIDKRGTIESFNPAAERIFGYAATEAIGQNVKMLMPEPYHSNHDGYLKHYLETGEVHVIGARTEVEGRRKGGKTFPMDLTVGEMQLGSDRRFVGMARDITDRKNVERIKDEFVSTVSHELRTPLTSIRGSLGLIVGGVIPQGAPERRQLLDIALANTERLVRLINDILDVEKIRSGKMRFDMKPVELLPLLSQAVQANLGYADTYGVGINLEDTQPGVWVLADRDRLMQVLTNLLSNAIKFSPRGDNVDVSMRCDEDGVRVTVTDRGPGIPKQFRHQIFERFTQANTSDSHRKEGTGLGLHLCRSIIRKLGGTIGFDTRDGAGTTFYFVLQERHLSRRQGTAPTVTELRPCILICEPDQNIARLLADMLQNDGYDSHIASSSERANTLITDNHYDAMTLNVRVSSPSGIELLRGLRANERQRHLPVIALSAVALEGRDSLSGGALPIIDWLSMPVDDACLRRAIAMPGRHRNVRPVQLLLVADDRPFAETTSQASAHLADVTWARTLADARRQLARGRFDVLCLQLDMPDGNGEDLLALLDLDDESPIPLILASNPTAEIDHAWRVAQALLDRRDSNALLLEKVRLALS